MRILTGLAKETRPIPVIATFAAIYFAVLLSGAAFNFFHAIFFISIFFLLYAVHFLDTYVDVYVRKEDSFKKFKFAHGASGVLTRNELICGAVVSSILFFIFDFYLAERFGQLFLLVTVFIFLIGISYSHRLSKNIILATASGPLGVVLAMSSAYMMSSGVFNLNFYAVLSSVFLLFLGGRIWMDIADTPTDKKTGKPTVALSMGKQRAKLLAFIVLCAGLVLSLVVLFSTANVVIVLALALVFYKGYSKDPVKGTSFIMGGIFIFIVLQILLQYALAM